METKEGEIQFVKSDRKSFKIEDVWYNNQFKELPKEIIKGMFVKVSYISKEGKNYYRSIVEVKKDIQEEKVVNAFDFNKQGNLAKKDSNKETLLPKSIPNQTENTCLMCACNIICKEIEKGYEYSPEELTSKIQKLSKDFIKAYNSLS